MPNIYHTPYVVQIVADRKLNVKHKMKASIIEKNTTHFTRKQN